MLSKTTKRIKHIVGTILDRLAYAYYDAEYIKIASFLSKIVKKYFPKQYSFITQFAESKYIYHHNNDITTSAAMFADVLYKLGHHVENPEAIMIQHFAVVLSLELNECKKASFYLECMKNSLEALNSYEQLKSIVEIYRPMYQDVLKQYELQCKHWQPCHDHV